MPGVPPDVVNTIKMFVRQLFAKPNKEETWPSNHWAENEASNGYAASRYPPEWPEPVTQSAVARATTKRMVRRSYDSLSSIQGISDFLSQSDLPPFPLPYSEPQSLADRGTNHRSLSDGERSGGSRTVLLNDESLPFLPNDGSRSLSPNYLGKDRFGFSLDRHLSTSGNPLPGQKNLYQGAISQSNREVRLPTDNAKEEDLQGAGVGNLQPMAAMTRTSEPRYRYTPQAIAQEFGWKSENQIQPNIQQGILTVVSSLGHGSLGVVEEVRVSPSHASFVRKRVQLPYHCRKQRLQIIKEEADTLRSLSHRHIVTILGTYEERPAGGRQFYSLLMHPVGQSDLKTHLEMVGETPGPTDSQGRLLKRWTRCLASALDYMHRKGVRHQDIKPSNIICRDEEIFFTDFSSSARFDVGQTTSTENPARTSAMYAAPEIVDSDGFLLKHGRGTDVFALGAVFCEMLAVIEGHSIQQFHDYLLAKAEGPAARAGGILLYGRCIDRIAEFFTHSSVFAVCMRAMLAANRDDRPTAQNMAATVRACVNQVTPCSCDEDLPRPSDLLPKRMTGYEAAVAAQLLKIDESDMSPEKSEFKAPGSDQSNPSPTFASSSTAIKSAEKTIISHPMIPRRNAIDSGSTKLQTLSRPPLNDHNDSASDTTISISEANRRRRRAERQRLRAERSLGNKVEFQ